MARILIVEDDANLRVILGSVATHAGHEVVVAADGQEALQAIRQAPPDVVVTDIIMPEKEGIELILSIRKEFPAIRIVAMSGGGQLGADHYLEMAQEFGADLTLAKPFDKQAFLAALREVLVGAAS